MYSTPILIAVIGMLILQKIIIINYILPCGEEVCLQGLTDRKRNLHIKYSPIFLKKASKYSQFEEIHITKREMQILSFIAKEFTSAQIAEHLFISDSTIEYHRRNLFLKFDVKNSTGLFVKLCREG